MTVKIVSYSKTDHTPSDSLLDLVAYCARVSNPNNQKNVATAKQLVKYLIANKHWSPLEMVSICLEVETTRDISRQILRHRSFSFQEFSQRYADPIKELDFVYRPARLQDHKNRQNSIEVDDPHLNTDWVVQQSHVMNAARDAYEWAIANGIAKEQARVVLPEGLMMTRMYMNGTLRSWVHYIELRSANGTQLEHQEIALECAKCIASIFPMLFNE
jgi:thymidylate synthase (FAD)|tara:strand:+ start:372 stop:1019 length:648 start_codon:yes stop_codon:yes gene_type:complete